MENSQPDPTSVPAGQSVFEDDHGLKDQAVSEPDMALGEMESKAPWDQPKAEPGAPVVIRERPRSSVSWMLWFILLMLTLLVIQQFVPYFVERVQYAVTRGDQRAKYEVARQNMKLMNLDTMSTAFRLVSHKVRPSVVHINISGHTAIAGDKPISPFFPDAKPREQGSGVIFDEAGYILTNYHVVRQAERIEVMLSDGRRVRGQVVGGDALTDLAVLKINADKLIAAEWGDSDDLEPGDLVWALGSPFGLQRSITFGIVSAKNRAGHKPHQTFLQSDVAVNPGNSGGPLVNARGKVVGINTAIVGEKYQGISFAIPSSEAKSVFQRLKTIGRIPRGWLGVTLRNVDARTARAVSLNRVSGARIDGFVAGPGPARDAGLQLGDVVLKWNGKKVSDSKMLIRMVGKTEIGSLAEVTVWRDGAEMTKKVKIGERPGKYSGLP